MSPTAEQGRIIELDWRIGAGGVERVIETGDTIYRDAVLTWKGQEQIRDITVHGDGTFDMGPDKLRGEAPAE